MAFPCSESVSAAVATCEQMTCINIAITNACIHLKDRCRFTTTFVRKCRPRCARSLPQPASKQVQSRAGPRARAHRSCKKPSDLRASHRQAAARSARRNHTVFRGAVVANVAGFPPCLTGALDGQEPSSCGDVNARGIESREVDTDGELVVFHESFDCG